MNGGRLVQYQVYQVERREGGREGRWVGRDGGREGVEGEWERGREGKKERGREGEDDDEETG